jgi:integrase
MSAIEKRGESSYRLTVSNGYNKYGKKIMKHKTIGLSHIKPNKREEEANKQWILFKDEIEKGIYLDTGNITFENFIQKWLKDYAEPELAPKTVFRYKEMLNTRIIPVLGNIKLNKLQPTHFLEFYNNLREKGIRLDKKYAPKKNFTDIITSLGFTLKDIILKSRIDESTLKCIKLGKNVRFSTVNKICNSININSSVLFDPVEQNSVLSERTILHHHRLISSILTYAVQWGFLLNNPASRVKAPKVEKKEAKHFDIEQTEYILDLLNNKPIKYRTMMVTDFYTGIREGELGALAWDDIDFDNSLINIDKSLQYLPGKGIFIKSTKNESSERIIYASKTVISCLREYRIWQNGQKDMLGNLWNNEHNSIFTNRNGGLIFPSTISKWCLKFIREHNTSIMNNDSIPIEKKKEYLLDEVNFHGIRHTNASIEINQGVDIVTVSKQLGHSRPSTTTDIYSHCLKEANKVAAEKLENLFNKNSSNK